MNEDDRKRKDLKRDVVSREGITPDPVALWAHDYRTPPLAYIVHDEGSYFVCRMSDLRETKSIVALLERRFRHE